MKVVSPAQMNEIDRYTIDQLGIPGIILMEHASLKIVEASKTLLEDSKNKRIVILAGKGNNGGDGLAAARILAVQGFHVEIYLLAHGNSLSGDAASNLITIQRMQLPLLELLESSQLPALERSLAHAALVIDGILGTGLKGSVYGHIASVINLVNQICTCPILSIDIPSGVSGETGEILGTCIQATCTVTFELPKIGLLVHPGCEAAGDVIIAPIGIPKQGVENAVHIRTHWIDAEMVLQMLPKRISDSNKGTYGKVLLIAGSKGMTGAGYLAGKAALRTGAGLVYLSAPKPLSLIYQTQLPEAIVLSLETDKAGSLSSANTPYLLEKIKGMSSVVMGPGLSTGESTAELVQKIITTCEAPLVLDADGLNILSKSLEILKHKKAPMVITPHPGEMARLCNCTIEAVQRNRIQLVREFAAAWKVVTVLKGARTLIASPDGQLYINSTGNPGMATGGTGDVLAGIIGAFLGQGLNTLEAALCGVYLHGLSGDLAAQEKGQYSLIAGDLPEWLPKAFLHITS